MACEDSTVYVHSIKGPQTPVVKEPSSLYVIVMENTLWNQTDGDWAEWALDRRERSRDTGQVRNGARVESPGAQQWAQPRKQRSRLTPFLAQHVAGHVLESPDLSYHQSCGLDPSGGTGGCSVASCDSHTSPCVATPLGVNPPGQGGSDQQRIVLGAKPGGC